MTYCILKAFQKGDGKYSYKKLYDTEHEPVNEPTYGEYLGEYVVIDIDNKTSEAVIDKWLHEFNVVTQIDRTQHGSHYWFKRPIQDHTQSCKLLLCGVRGDYRCKEWVTVKRDGYVYKRENAGVIADYPWFLKIIGNSKEKAEFTWLDDENLSRNDSLRNAMLQMHKYVDDIADHIKLVNKLTLHNPLSTNELESTILRKESIEYCDNNADDSESELNRVCLALMSDYTIIKHNDELYYFNGEIYEPFTIKARQIMARGLAKNPTDRFKKDVINNISDYLEEYDGRVDVGHYVAFNDCLYNCDTHECEPFTENVVVTMKLKFDYPKCADTPNMVDEIINKLLCGNKDDINTLYEYLGYILHRDMKLEKALTFNGDGYNGKSSILDLITYTFKDCCTALPFKKLFAKNGLQVVAQNMFVYAHEMTSDYIKDATVFKEVLSNNPTIVEDKYVKQHEISDYNCKFIYCNNGTTKMDVSCIKAINRRLLPIQFEYDLSQEKRDLNFYRKWLTKENAERLLYLAIEGLKRLQERGGFKISQRSADASEKYVTDLDTVRQWVNDYDGSVLYELVDPLYNLYKQYVFDNTNSKKVSKEKFKTQVCEILKAKTSRITDNDGKRKWLFVSEDDNTKSHEKEYKTN
jgi:putative DNA primase/helicase